MKKKIRNPTDRINQEVDQDHVVDRKMEIVVHIQDLVQVLVLKEDIGLHPTVVMIVVVIRDINIVTDIIKRSHPDRGVAVLIEEDIRHLGNDMIVGTKLRSRNHSVVVKMKCQQRRTFVPDLLCFTMSLELT